MQPFKFRHQKYSSQEEEQEHHSGEMLPPTFLRCTVWTLCSQTFALCQPASFPMNSSGGSSFSLCELYLVSGWFTRKNRKEMSQTGRETADAAVMGSDKAMNCGWRLSSKVLNKDAAICDSKINVIFFPLRSLFSIFTLGELSKKVPLSDIYEAPEWGGL